MFLKERLEVTGSSWLFNILHEMRDKGQPPDFEDGEWQRNRKTGRHWRPLTLIKTNFLKLTGRVHQISRTMTRFFQLRWLLIKPGNNTALGNESFLYLFQLQFYWKSQGTWIMWTFLYFPHTHDCQEGPHLFSEGTLEEELWSHPRRWKKKRRKGRFYWSLLSFGI